LCFLTSDPGLPFPRRPVFDDIGRRNLRREESRTVTHEGLEQVELIPQLSDRRIVQAFALLGEKEGLYRLLDGLLGLRRWQWRLIACI